MAWADKSNVSPKLRSMNSSIFLYSCTFLLLHFFQRLFWPRHIIHQLKSTQNDFKHVFGRQSIFLTSDFWIIAKAWLNTCSFYLQIMTRSFFFWSFEACYIEYKVSNLLSSILHNHSIHLINNHEFVKISNISILCWSNKSPTFLIWEIYSLVSLCFSLLFCLYIICSSKSW